MVGKMLSLRSLSCPGSAAEVARAEWVWRRRRVELVAGRGRATLSLPLQLGGPERLPVVTMIVVLEHGGRYQDPPVEKQVPLSRGSVPVKGKEGFDDLVAVPPPRPLGGRWLGGR